MSVIFFIKLFITAFLINFFWEAWHSELYTTCHRMKYTERMRLLTLMSLKDAFWICVFFGGTVAIFGTTDMFSNTLHAVIFLALTLGFSFIDEYVSVCMRRWEYAGAMPTLLGVGLTPLLELAVTGLLAVAFALYI